jgi:hypothetical protein
MPTNGAAELQLDLTHTPLRLHGPLAHRSVTGGLCAHVLTWFPDCFKRGVDLAGWLNPIGWVIHREPK